MKARQASVHPVVDETRTTDGGNGAPIGRALITRGCLCGLEIVKWLAFLSPPADQQHTAAACACAGITVLIDIDVAPCWVNNLCAAASMLQPQWHSFAGSPHCLPFSSTSPHLHHHNSFLQVNSSNWSGRICRFPLAAGG
ncbi:hypothetical protein SDJN03_02869, partial [Cucurbita argyrosperma subsp. sororia]